MKDKNYGYKKCSGIQHTSLTTTFVGVHGDKLFLRLSDSEVAEVMRDCKDAVAFEPTPRRAMKGYVVSPKTVYSDDKLFAMYLDKSINYVSSLPPKKTPKK